MMLLEHAERIAKDLVEQLEPCCVRVDVAGSVRRKKLQVGDIEICCIPNTKKEQTTFFEKQEVPVDKFREIVNRFDRIKGHPDGKYVQRRHDDGVKLDFFMPAEHDYYRQFALRTGPRKYSWQVLARSWSLMGWCGTSEGLRRKDECYKLGSGRWTCRKLEPTLPPVWKSEQEFFEWLQLDYVKPINRKNFTPV